MFKPSTILASLIVSLLFLSFSYPSSAFACEHPHDGADSSRFCFVALFDGFAGELTLSRKGNEINPSLKQGIMNDDLLLINSDSYAFVVIAREGKVEKIGLEGPGEYRIFGDTDNDTIKVSWSLRNASSNRNQSYDNDIAFHPHFTAVTSMDMVLDWPSALENSLVSFAIVEPVNGEISWEINGNSIKLIPQSEIKGLVRWKAGFKDGSIQTGTLKQLSDREIKRCKTRYDSASLIDDPYVKTLTKVTVLTSCQLYPSAQKNIDQALNSFNKNSIVLRMMGNGLVQKMSPQ